MTTFLPFITLEDNENTANGLMKQLMDRAELVSLIFSIGKGN